MAVAYYHTFPAATPEMAKQVSDYVNQQIGTQAPPGGIYHAEGPLDDGGWWGFDVWESTETAEQFYAAILTPALQHANLAQPETRIMSVEWQTNAQPGG